MKGATLVAPFLYLLGRGEPNGVSCVRAGATSLSVPSHSPESVLCILLNVLLHNAERTFAPILSLSKDAATVLGQAQDD